MRVAEHHRHADAIPADHNRPFTGEVRDADLLRAAAQGHAALQADRQPDLLRRLEPRLPQRRLQPDRCGCGRAQPNGELGVHDVFQAEIADTWEVGVKSQFLDRRLTAECGVCSTPSRPTATSSSSIATTSTQNLGNLDATYKGAELELTATADRPARPVRRTSATPTARSPAWKIPRSIGNKPPLLTKDTVNAGFQYHQPLGDGLNGVLRLDYQMIGRTWWDPYNVTSRDPVNLLDLRAGRARATAGR